jgi:hypothetical protein
MWHVIFPVTLKSPDQLRISFIFSKSAMVGPFILFYIPLFLETSVPFPLHTFPDSVDWMCSAVLHNGELTAKTKPRAPEHIYDDTSGERCCLQTENKHCLCLL